MKIDERTLEDRAIRQFAAWRADWVLFATDVFGAYLDDEQKAILRAFQHEHRVSVRSGTARGKDFIAAICALCFFYLTPKWDVEGNMVENTKVALTAPTDRQVKNIMMPEISRQYNKAKRRDIVLPGRLTTSDIRTNSEEWFLTGFKADEHNHEAWSGFHAVHTAFIVTEATGIIDDTFEAIEGNLQGDSRLLLVFNPNTTVGYAARSQKSRRWKTFCLSSLNAPNVLQRKIVIPGQVDYDWLKDKVENWCTPINEDEKKDDQDDFVFDGHWYRPSDLFRKKGLGQFPLADEGCLIPLKWVEIAEDRWRAHGGLKNHNFPRIGADVAGMGRDNTTFCYRFDNYVDRIEKHNSGGKADHMKVAGHLVNDFKTTTGCIVFVDTIGEGAGVYSRLLEVFIEDPDLKEQIANVVSCKFSESAKRSSGTYITDLTGQYSFVNLRAYCYWSLREWLDPANGNDAILPLGGTLKEELTEIQWSFRSDGKIIIEPKEDIKKRLGYSPDESDALANTFHPQQLSKPDMTYYPPDYDENADLY